MKIFKYLALAFVTIYLLICVAVKVFEKDTVLIAGEKVLLEKSWMEFNEDDDSKIGNLIRAYHFEEGERRFKKNIGQDDFVIACLKKDKKWNLFILSWTRNL